jgi:hypothetical protein
MISRSRTVTSWKRRSAPPPTVMRALTALTAWISSATVTGPDAARAAVRGPYARAAARLIAEHAGPLRRLLARYDELVVLVGSRPARTC